VGLEIEKLIKDYNEIVAQIEDYESILGDDGRVLHDHQGRLRRDEGAVRLGRARQAPHRDRGGRGRHRHRGAHPRGGGRGHDHAGRLRQARAAEHLPGPGAGRQGHPRVGRWRGGRRQHLFVASTHDDLLCFTDQGRVFKIKVYELPELGRTSRGRAIQNYIQLRKGERTYAYRAVKNFESGSEHLLFISKGGIVKRTPLKAYANVNKSGLIAVGLKEGDSLFDVRLTSGNDDIILVTSAGMAIRFNEHEDRGGLRDMGRSAAGVKGIDLADGVEIVGAAIVPMRPAGDDESDWDGPTTSLPGEDGKIPDLLTITDKGYGKRTAVDEYRVTSEDGSQRSQSRGGKGRIDLKLSGKNGTPVAAFAVSDSDDVVVISRMGSWSGSRRPRSAGTGGARRASASRGSRRATR
jgi:DNA gyrase subunit A